MTSGVPVVATDSVVPVRLEESNQEQANTEEHRFNNFKAELVVKEEDNDCPSISVDLENVKQDPKGIGDVKVKHITLHREESDYLKLEPTEVARDPLRVDNQDLDNINEYQIGVDYQHFEEEREHKRLKLSKNDLNLYPCNKCEYTTSYSCNLKRHKERWHGTNSYPCEQCVYVGKTLMYLEQHKAAHHDGIRYPCDQCEYSAKEISHLRTHYKAKHQGVRYPCDQCPYEATQQSALNLHKKNIHERIRYPCDLCDYLGTTLGTLKQHQATYHEGIRYPCNQCKLAFTVKRQLKIHIESKHQGIKYPCDYCSYAATQKSSLKRHIITQHKKVVNKEADIRGAQVHSPGGNTFGDQKGPGNP